ncbi:hypothetical protein F6455_13955 [Proteobacteria bacterium 005FR1]|nr:hypothetical protein [Proteobacteria bacterium 005FR1]
MNNEKAQLNRVGDAAAADLQEFYEEQLDNDVQGVARYEAHLYLGLLGWRAGNQQVMEEHLPAAASIVTQRFVERSEQQSGQSISPFEFMIPSFLTFVFGEQPDREALTRVRDSAWAAREENEFASVTALLELITSNAASREFAKTDVEKLAQLNASEQTHRFYQPWIATFCDGLIAILDGDIAKLDHACQKLYELHEEQALEGEWQLRLESVLDFWTSALVKVAKHYNVAVSVNSPYVPRL